MNLDLIEKQSKPSPKRKNHIFNNEGIEGKECSSCKDWKQLDLYYKNNVNWDKLRHECNDCLKLSRQKNKEKITDYNKIYWLKTQHEQKEKNKLWRENNKEQIKEKMKEYRLLHGKEIDKKQWQQRKNDEKYKLKQAIYRRKFEIVKRKTDINFKLKQNISRRIRELLKNFGTIKSQSSINYVGCDLKDLRNHLESTFQNGMTWENYGEWHIDHIIPCSAWNLENENEQKLCFYYKNLQALWAIDNIIKKDYYSIEDKQNYVDNVSLIIFNN